MNNKIHPCLWFDGQATEAAAFYSSIFPNSKITNDTAIVVNFDIMGYKLTGLNGGPKFKINHSISLFVTFETEKEVDEIYNRLSEGGEALMALGKYNWSERYGWIKDKFGLSWQIMLGSDKKLSASLLFTGDNFGRAEEAVNFYTSLFKNASIHVLQHYEAETPFAGKLLFSEFDINKYNMIAMDGPGDHHFTFNEGLSFVVECQNQEEIDYYWNTFTEEGEESMCGWLKDKFGVSWQIVPAILGKLMSDQEKAPRVMKAFLKMKKFDIETLLKA